jgi:hypothetical protein
MPTTDIRPDLLAVMLPADREVAVRLHARITTALTAGDDAELDRLAPLIAGIAGDNDLGLTSGPMHATDVNTTLAGRSRRTA